MVRITDMPPNAAMFSPRDRRTLHALLHRDVKQCKATDLFRMVREGCATNAAHGYDLTALGRRCAELAETCNVPGWIEIDASVEPWVVRAISKPDRRRAHSFRRRQFPQAGDWPW